MMCVALAARAADETPQAEQPAIEVGRSIFVVNEVDGQDGRRPRQAARGQRRHRLQRRHHHRRRRQDDHRIPRRLDLRDRARRGRADRLVRVQPRGKHQPQDAAGDARRVPLCLRLCRRPTRRRRSSPRRSARWRSAARWRRGSSTRTCRISSMSARATRPLPMPPAAAALQPGNAIAVPSASTAADGRPSAMPAPVAAQALAVIEKRLPPREALRNRPAADEAWLKRQGAADLVPAAAAGAAPARPARPMPNAGRARLAGRRIGPAGRRQPGRSVPRRPGRAHARTGRLSRPGRAGEPGRHGRDAPLRRRGADAAQREPRRRHADGDRRRRPRRALARGRCAASPKRRSAPTPAPPR